ncbi:esterase/lipase family protein [Luteimonas lutimaris]|uniref:GPI inositol-deacylase PGAP1-like alpha/beta domain-containing protein n=1 Tax=Luteimonas lutimaris TaxID=698645 RepID=A0ABP7MMV0_9GAMM
MAEEEQILFSTLDEDGDWVTSTRLTPSGKEGKTHLLADPRPVIPVIFLPGIMGTNLRNKHTGERVWRPLNASSLTFGSGNWREAGWAAKYLMATAAERQRLLDPDTTEVDPEGKVYYRIDLNSMPGRPDEKRKFRLGWPDLRNLSPIKYDWRSLAIDEKEAKHRGYGTVMQSAYQPALANFEVALNRMLHDGELATSWAQGDDMYGMQAPPADYGDKYQGSQLVEDEIRKAAEYRFEFWAVGYNWIRSNADSAAHVIDQIENRIIPHYRELLGAGIAGKMKVILLTHSMGGLVARAMSGVHGYGRVLGSVIGAMPAEGAPLTYKMLRTGADSFAMKYIAQGQTGIHLAAQLSRSNGGLELLPSARYGGTNGGWLKLRRVGAGKGANEDQLPRAGDPYDEIYRCRSWYGLIPSSNVIALDFSATKNASAAGYASRGGDLDPFNDFDDKIDEVQDFHERIADQCPKPAYVHIGADGDKKRVAYEEVVWAATGNGPLRFELLVQRRSRIQGEYVPAGNTPVPMLDPAQMPEWMRSLRRVPSNQRKHAAALKKVFEDNLANQLEAGISLGMANANGMWGDSLNGRLVLAAVKPAPPATAPLQEDGAGETVQLEEIVITAATRTPGVDDVLVEVVEKDGPGDGTVPRVSAIAPWGWSGVKAFFAVGTDGRSSASGRKTQDIKGRREPGYEHQDAYNDNRARWASMYSLVKLAQSADWSNQ